MSEGGGVFNWHVRPMDIRSLLQRQLLPPQYNHNNILTITNMMEVSTHVLLMIEALIHYQCESGCDKVR